MSGSGGGGLHPPSDCTKSGKPQGHRGPRGQDKNCRLRLRNAVGYNPIMSNTTADSPKIKRQALLPLFSDALAFAAAQCDRVLANHPGYTPMYTVGGKWDSEGERWTHWCEGFYPG